MVAYILARNQRFRQIMMSNPKNSKILARKQDSKHWLCDCLSVPGRHIGEEKEEEEKDTDDESFQY